MVGAGYAGLTAAWRLAQHGRSVIVTEARDRIGGRVWSAQLDSGAIVDRGGAWIAPGHTAFQALAGEVGVHTYKTWVAGAHLLVGDDRIRRYTGLIPRIGPAALITTALALSRANRMARKVPVDAPWSAGRASEWDGRTVAWWLERTGIRTPLARDLFDMAVRGLFACDTNNASLLHLLFLANAHGGLDKLFAIEGGAQENLVDGGAGAVAARLAERLGDGLRLGEPVRAITQAGDRVTVETDAASIEAGTAIVTIPPALIPAIAWDPPLPGDRAALYHAAVAGEETKTVVVYDEPFWRDDGLSGQTSDPGAPSEVTIDASPESGRPGVLASFTFAQVAQRTDAMAAGDRREAVLASLVRRLGPKAATPAAFVETAWWSEEWSKGCSLAHLPPGMLTRHGHLLRQPWKRIHWAGTETATVSHGAIDGAVRSGERAAGEVLDRP